MTNCPNVCRSRQQSPVPGQLSQCQRTQYSHNFGDIFLKHIEINPSSLLCSSNPKYLVKHSKSWEGNQKKGIIMSNVDKRALITLAVRAPAIGALMMQMQS